MLNFLAIWASKNAYPMLRICTLYKYIWVENWKKCPLWQYGIQSHSKDALSLIHGFRFSLLLLCLCCMLRESYTSRCDTITICIQQQRSCMLVLRAAQHKHKEREGLEYNRRAVFENRRESLHICSLSFTILSSLRVKKLSYLHLAWKPSNNYSNSH